MPIIADLYPSPQAGKGKPRAGPVRSRASQTRVVRRATPSERNLVIHVAARAAAGARHGWLALARSRAGRSEVVASALIARLSATAGLVEHGEHGIEALQYDLGRIAILA